jgi:hypothetical protein
MGRMLVLLLCLAVAGCGLARQRELQEKIAALRQQSAAAMQECNTQWPPGNPKTAVARAQCVNSAMAILQPTMPYPDLLQVWMANHLARAEQVQSGRVTMAQANAALTEKWSALISEEQKRTLANRSVAAQEQTASAAQSSAAAAWAANAPRTCSAMGNSVTCF